MRSLLQQFQLPPEGDPGYIGLRPGAYELAVVSHDWPQQQYNAPVGRGVRFEMFIYVAEVDGVVAQLRAEGTAILREWSMAQTALGAARGPRADALREVMADLLDTPDGATHVVSIIGGNWQHYDLPGDHPLIGHRAPDLPLDGGTTLAEHFRDGRAVLLDANADAAAVVPAWADRVTVVAARPTAFADQQMAALFRPDGYTAWVTLDGADEDGLRAALTTWLGPPGPATSL